MKDIRKLPEEEVLKMLLPTAKDYMRRLTLDRDFQVKTCMNWQMMDLERLYRKSCRFWFRKGQDEGETLEAFLSRYEPLVMQQTMQEQEKFDKKRLIHEINATTAEALLTPAFEATGLKFSITRQMRQVTMCVYINDKRYLRFHVTYASLRKENRVEELVKAVLDAAEALSRIGKDVKVI